MSGSFQDLLKLAQMATTGAKLSGGLRLELAETCRSAPADNWAAAEIASMIA